ncbi:MAG: IPT/TIG domain-containing protein, partial [Elusimicrobia bacterium]|nr:IPT/TIG domain-containing protein [Elusimicrobiota bacterium]
MIGLSAAAVDVDKYLAPGDAGRMVLTVQNLPESETPVLGVDILTGTEPRFQIEATSVLHADVIAPGEAHEFFIDYSILPDAEEGSFSIDVTQKSETEGLVPDISSFVSKITFKVDALAPSLTIYDSRGLLASDGATRGLGMLFAADDRRGPNGQAAAVAGGIAKIEVFTDPPVTSHLIGSNSTVYDEHHTYSLSELGLTSLPQGRIHVTVTDKAGNETSKILLVDRVVPTIALANNEEVPILSGGLTDSAFITAICADAESGVDEIGIYNSAGGSAVRGPIYEKGAPEIWADFVDLPDSNADENYIARVLDRAGNQTDFPFRVRRAPFAEFSFTATHQYNYVFQYYGASVQTFSIPYSTAAFLLADPLGVSAFELKRNGAVLLSESYPADTFTKNVSLDLADGVYEFRVDTVRGQSTSGTFTKYSVGVTPVLTRPQATARHESGQFLVNFPVTCSNNGPIGTGLSALTIRRVGVEGTGVDAHHVFQETAASLACGGSYDGHLDDGLYAVVGLDRGYEIVRYFRVDTQPVGLPLGFYKGIANQVNTELFGQTLVLTHDGQWNYAPSGSAETAPAELFSSTDNFVVPYGAFGVALTTPTESALDFATAQGTYTDVAGDTGLSQAFALSVDGGPFESIARWKLFFTDRLAECGGANPCPFDYDYHLDQNLTAARILGSTIKLRQTLTTNSAVFGGNAPGTVTPLAGAPTLPLFYIMASTVALEDMPLDSAAGMPLIAGGPAFQISTYLTKVIVTLGDPNDPTIRAKIAELGSRGQQLAGGDIAVVDPPVVRFNAPTVATMRFDPAAVTAAGISLNDLALYQAEPGGNFYRVANQVLSVSQGFISAPVLTLSQASLFGIFGPGTAPSAPIADVLPPRTTFSGNPSSTEGQTISVSSLSVLAFSAPDDKSVVGDAQGVGVQRTYYAVDGGGFVVSPGTFSLIAEGTHTLTFFSVDLLGNAEQTKTQSATVDLTPPSGVVVSSRALFAVSAVDPLVNGASSGIQEIRFLIDFNPQSCNGAVPNPLAAPGTCENQTYTGPFALSNGPHAVAFRMIDKVGNDSQWQSQPLEVVPQSENGGLGIGRDAFDSFWNVLNSAQSIGFARSSALGVLLSSAALEDAVSGLPWSVFFDSSDRAYAIGGAGGLTTQAVDLAVYKASEDGSAIESRTLFDSGYANNDMVFDAKAPGWIVGAAQTSGPVDFEAPGDRTFSLALWKFDPALGSVQLKTTYARAGFDLGASLAVDSDGSLWIAGYSLSPAAPAVGGFDLALWHYASDGQTVLGGPFLRPGYLDNIDGGLTARVFVSSEAVFVAAPRADADGGTDMAFLRYDKATGQPTSENAWRSADGASAYPVAILPTASGLLVAGGIGDAFTEAALWRFGLDGALQSATTAGAGGARGAVFRGSELWLSVDGSSVPYRVQTEAVAAGALIDLQPPRTALAAGDPSFVEGGTTYAAGSTPFGFSVVDDNAVVGDGLGVGATQTFYADGAGAYVPFTSSFTLVAEGTHTLSFYSIDLKGHAEAAKTSSVAVDLTAPAVVLASSGTVFTLSAVDPVVGGASAGVGQVLYLVDEGPDCEGIPESTAAAPGTCANPFYAGAFALAIGTHTVHYAAVDRVGNGELILYSSSVVVGAPVAVPVLTPSSGPIGVPFSITGTGFGVYGGANTRVKFGTVAAPLSVWNNTTISGTIPGLSTGSYAVAIERQNASSVTSVSAGSFAVTDLNTAALNVSSGPIGVPFTITGMGFGPYAGTLSRVLVDGATAPLSVWNNTTIAGTLPGVTPGAKTIVIQRAAGSVLSTSDGFAFEVTVPSVTAVSPSSGPIGAAYTLTGFSFGPYAGTNTRVLFGGATTALSLWSDRVIKGTVPGSLSPGVQTVVVQRLTAGGGLVESGAASFQVAGLALASLTPSSGPIGVPFTISGMGFGAYDGANTRVRFGVSTAALSLWNDTTITGTIPALEPGAWSVVVERQQGSSVSTSSSATFTATALSVSVLSPSSGPIGAPFTITGSQFGVYGGANTRVKFNGVVAPLSVWNDSTITGTVPALSTGVASVVVERQQGAFVAASGISSFTVVELAPTGMTPETGPIGTAFTITGSGFGPYNGANTRLMIGGVVASLSLWNDTTISGTIPDLPAGAQPLWIERSAGTGVQSSATNYFTVTTPVVASLTPSSAPIGAPFTLTGASFGAYGGANTRVTFNGVVAALSLWNDTTITGTVPALPAGVVDVVVERQQGAGVVASSSSAFTVLDPAVGGLSPSAGPIGTAFTLTGSGFGPYAGTNTRVLIGGVAAALSLWNDTTITGTIPALPSGAQPVWLERSAGSGVASSATSYFTITTPEVASLTPSSAPIGAPFTITGTSFGAYAGANTRVKFNGVVAPLSVWNDTTITGTVPGTLSPGDAEVIVERAAGAGLVVSATQAFYVLAPAISTVSPSFGPVGTVVTVTGAGFGPYSGTLTRLLVGGATVPLSVWNDTTIRWTVPSSLGDGEYPVVVERSPAGGTVQS